MKKELIELRVNGRDHELAVAPNRVLLDMVEQFIRRTRRYEVALMRDGRNVATATHEHEAVMDALEQGDLAGACAALRRNLETGFAPIAEWLRTREET